MTDRGRVLIALTSLPLLLAACVTAGRREADRSDVEIMGPWRDSEADRFAEVLAPFESVSGIDVRYVGSGDFVSDLRQRASEGADPPDIAVIPQLGLVDELIAQELVLPLDDDVRREVLENFGVDETTAAEEGGVHAIPFRSTVKSLVWFRPELFDEHDWQIPETLEELEALVDTIQDDTDLAPWCFSIEAGSATGWAATDWIEDLVLHAAGAEVYQDWVDGEVRFADDEIADAFGRFHDLVLAPGRTAGGTRAIIERPVDEAWEPLLAPEPGCALYKQADFATGWMPAGLEIGPDDDIYFFAMPSEDADDALAVAGGDQIVQFDSNEDIDEVMAYLAGSSAPSIWARQGGFIAANPQVPDDVYPERYRVALTDVLAGSEVLVDASDWMPPDVGADLFWEQITSWIAGSVDYATLAETLDEAMDVARESLE